MDSSKKYRLSEPWYKLNVHYVFSRDKYTYYWYLNFLFVGKFCNMSYSARSVLYWKNLKIRKSVIDHI